VSDRKVARQVFEEIEDIAPGKAEKYEEIAREYREGHHLLPGGLVTVPVGIKEIAEKYEVSFEEGNARKIAERTVLVYFLNEGVLTENIVGEELEGSPSSFIEHLQINASRQLQNTVCRLYKEIYPYEWKDLEQDVKEALEIPEKSEFPSEEVKQ